MGSSATSKLCFGVEVESIKNLPWFQSPYIDTDDDGKEWWRVQNGFDDEAHPLTDGFREKSWEAREEFDKKIDPVPFEVFFHGNAYSEDSATVIVGLPEPHHVKGWCGEAVEIEPEFLEIDKETVGKFTEFLTKYGFPTQPKWFLLSSYG